MTEKAFNQIWTTIAIVALYTAVNTYLKTQGSELFLNFPKVEGADKSAITVYGILISAPLLLFSIRLTFVYKKHFGGATWDSKIPIALSRHLVPGTSLSRAYQRVSVFVFYILPVALQIHLLRKFFEGVVFLRGIERCPDMTEAYYSANLNKDLAKGMWQHLTHFEPFWCTWQNNFAYASTRSAAGKVTFFPGYQSWFFLLLEVVLFAYCIYLFYSLFKSQSKKPDPNQLDIFK